MRILALGGTIEARELAGHLAGRPELDVTLSLAGRTAAPMRQPVPVRIGGFGGPEGLADYLCRERVDLLVDATHPYAAMMSSNAAQAAALTGTTLVALVRPPWMPIAGDRWREVADTAEAVRALGDEPRRVFLALGRNELAPFCTAPAHYYLVRSVDPVEPPLAVPRADYVLGRGPFDEAADRDLLLRHRIDVMVAKNSGGSATYGKIAAARALHIEVIMLCRPPLPDVARVETVEAALAFIDHALALSVARGV
jgi:precorrin-6A/cobalt-precorrin-6A reductase